MPTSPHPLKHLLPGWFSLVMGLAGLAIAWQRAEPLMGEPAVAVALVFGVLAALAFVALAVASLLRLQRHPEAWAEDRRHPLRHPLIATLPTSLLLLASVAVLLLGPLPAARAAWWLGALGQLWVTLWVLGRWWRPTLPNAPSPWIGVTPALLVPVVGNVIVPLGGVPLGHVDWSAAQFGIGALFWPVLLALLLVRVAQQGLWPERLLPGMFILVAPPAVIGSALLQFGAPPALAWGLWGVALFTLLWVGRLAVRIRNQPFGVMHWAISFPLAALTALTLRLAEPASVLAVLGPLLLALTTLVVVALGLATVRGLRDGTLLAPEPVALMVSAAKG